MKRIFFITLSVLLALLLATTATVWWLLYDQDWIKGQVQELVSEMTGRQFLIEGPLDITLAAHPVIEAQGLSLANAPWAEPAEMIHLDQLRMSFDLRSVFTDQFGILFIEIDGLDLALAENDEGEVNWDMFPAAEEEPEPKEPLTKLPYRVGRVTLTGFSLSHEAPGRTEPLSFSIDELVATRLENQQIDTTARGALDGSPLTLDGYLGPLNHLLLGGKMDGKLDLTVGEVQLNFQGHVEDSLTFDGIDVVINFSGPDFVWVTNELALPDFSSGKFDFDLKVDSSEHKTLIDLVGDLGSLDINASGVVDDILAPSEGNIELDMTGPDLQKLVAAFGEPNLPAEPYQLKGDLSVRNAVKHVHNMSFKIGENQGQLDGKIGQWPKLNDSDFDIWLKGPDISVWGPLARIDDLSQQAYELSGRFSNTNTGVVLTTTRLEVGDSYIEVAGSLGELPGLVGAALDVTAMSPDLGQIRLLPDMGDFPVIPVTIQGNLGRNEQLIFLNKLNFTVGADSVTVDGAIPIEDFSQGSEVEARAKIQSLGALGDLFGFEGLPDYPLQLNADARMADGGLELEVKDSNLGELNIDLEGHLPDLGNINNASVRFQLAIPSIRSIPYDIKGLELPSMPGAVKGRFDYQDGLIVLRDLDGHVGENTFIVDSTVSQGPELAGSQVEFSIAGPKLSSLVPLESLKSLPDRFKVSGRIIKGSDADRIEALEIELGSIKAKLDGTVDDLRNISTGDVVFSIAGPSLRELVPLESLQSFPDRFKASGRIIKGSDSDRIEALEIELGSMKATLDGTVDDLMNISSADVALTASGPDLSLFSSLLDRELPPHPFSINAAAKGKDRFFKADPIRLAWGPSELNGSFTLGLGERIAFNGQFQSELMSLAWLTAPKEQEPAAETEEKRDRVFPDTPIPENLFGDLKLDLDLELHAGEIILDFTELYGVDLELEMKDRLIQMDANIAGGPLGEKISSKFTFDTRADEAKLDFTMDGDGFRFGVMEVEDQGPETTPPTDFVIRAEGHGHTWHDLASSLNGRFRLHQDAGLIDSAGMNLIFSDLLTELLNTLNPYAKEKPYTELECSLVNAVIKDGQVAVDPLLYQTREITIVSGGTIDLVSEKVILDFHTQVRKGIGLSAGMVINPFIRLGGSLSSPAIQLDPAGVAVKGTVAVATVGLSVLARSLYDRFLSGKDPCGKAYKKLLKEDAEGGD